MEALAALENGRALVASTTGFDWIINCLYTATWYKKGQPAGLFFPTESAFKEATYKVDLRESAELGAANTRAANKIFEILRQPPRRWWQLWK